MKYVRRTTKEKTVQSPKASSGKRIKSATKVTKLGKKKQPAQELETLSEIAMSEAEQMKIALERSKTQQHSSHASGSGKSSKEEDDDEVAANDDDDDDNDDADNQDDKGQEYDEHNDEEQGDDDEQTDSDNDSDDFVHPKFSTHDEECKEEDSFDPRLQTPYHLESTDDEDSDEEIQGANVKGDKQDEEETNEEAEANELYRDVNVKDTHVIITALVNPEGQQQGSSVSSGFVSNMLNPSLDTGIDSIFNLNTRSTSLVDVLVTAIAEPPLLSVITTPPPPTLLIIHLQQTPTPTPATVPSSSL
ncbi:hypothetical protein Tco_0765893 [Tanacetum coccineum]